MELQACIQRARIRRRPKGAALGVQRVLIVTDSLYVFDNFRRAHDVAGKQVDALPRLDVRWRTPICGSGSSQHRSEVSESERRSSGRRVKSRPPSKWWTEQPRHAGKVTAEHRPRIQRRQGRCAPRLLAVAASSIRRREAGTRSSASTDLD